MSQDTVTPKGIVAPFMAAFADVGLPVDRGVVPFDPAWPSQVTIPGTHTDVDGEFNAKREGGFHAPAVPKN